MSSLEPVSRTDRAPFTDDEMARAFEGVVRAYYGRLCSFVYRYVNSTDVAEDIVQDVLVKAWRRRDQIDYRSPLPYLYQAARNEAISLQRHLRMRERAAADIAAEQRTVPDPGKRLEREELAEAVTAAINTLPPQCRMVFTLQREQGMTYAQIAATLGVSVKTVETHMGRAFRALRRQLAGYLVAALTVMAAMSRGA